MLQVVLKGIAKDDEVVHINACISTVLVEYFVATVLYISREVTVSHQSYIKLLQTSVGSDGELIVVFLND